MKKRIPSKTSNYADLINENGFYVDKTRFIELFERINDKYLFFLRPRRFGKSLFISTLEHYYGKQFRDRFEDLFGEYYIGQPQNVTPLRNSYMILKFDFSGLETQEESSVQRSFNIRISKSVNEFVANYGGFETDLIDKYESELTPGDYLSKFLSSVSTKIRDSKIFVLIDEYDHFTNELFAFNPNHFKEIVSQNGWVRKFYEVIKQFAGDGIIDRFFASGVTPIILDSMTSGFNIAKNITTDYAFNKLAGFTESEVVNLINGTLDDDYEFDMGSLISEIRSWYNGSKFAIDAEEKLYNPQMLLNFLGYLSLHRKYPSTMYDSSVSSDYSKIRKQLNLVGSSESNEVLKEIIENERIQGGITVQYNFEKQLTRTELISLLFYNGMLTIDSGEGKIIDYVVPNYVIKTMYWDLLREQVLSEEIGIFRETEILEIFKEMRFEGKIDKLMNYLNELLQKIVTNRDLIRFTEANLKMLMLPILSFSDIYKIDSEIEINRKYLDLLLTLQPEYKGNYSFLFELKYVKQAESDKYEDYKANGIEQLQNYLNLKNLTKNKNLKAFLIIFLNDKGEAIEV